MAKFTTFFLLFIMLAVNGSIVSATSFQQSSCSDEWPSGPASGRVELSYEIDENCAPINFKILSSEPEGIFDAAAMCLVENGSISPSSVWPRFSWRDVDLEHAISESEYRRLLQEYRVEHPDKFHKKSLPVLLENESWGIVTCFFTEDRSRTGAEIMEDGDSDEPRGIEDFSVIPVQFFESNFSVL